MKTKSVLKGGGGRRSASRVSQIGDDLEVFNIDRRVLSDICDNSIRRSIVIHRLPGQPCGFTLQSYGVFRKSSQHTELITYVDYVQIGGPACHAGLRPGDVILSIDGTSVEAFDHVTLVNFIKNSPNPTMRMVVLFDDCCRKIDLHSRNIKLEQLLSEKLFELHILERQEQQLVRRSMSASQSQDLMSGGQYIRDGDFNKSKGQDVMKGVLHGWGGQDVLDDALHRSRGDTTFNCNQYNAHDVICMNTLPMQYSPTESDCTQDNSTITSTPHYNLAVNHDLMSLSSGGDDVRNIIEGDRGLTYDSVDREQVLDDNAEHSKAYLEIEMAFNKVASGKKTRNFITESCDSLDHFSSNCNTPVNSNIPTNENCIGFCTASQKLTGDGIVNQNCIASSISNQITGNLTNQNNSDIVNQNCIVSSESKNNNICLANQNIPNLINKNIENINRNKSGMSNQKNTNLNHQTYASYQSINFTNKNDCNLTNCSNSGAAKQTVFASDTINKANDESTNVANNSASFLTNHNNRAVGGRSPVRRKKSTFNCEMYKESLLWTLNPSSRRDVDILEHDTRSPCSRTASCADTLRSADRAIARRRDSDCGTINKRRGSLGRFRRSGSVSVNRLPSFLNARRGSLSKLRSRVQEYIALEDEETRL